MLLEHGHVIMGDEGSRRGRVHHFCSSLAVASVSHSSSRGSSRQMRCHSPLRTHQTHEVGSICSNLQAGGGGGGKGGEGEGEREGEREGRGRGRGRGKGDIKTIPVSITWAVKANVSTPLCTVTYHHLHLQSPHCHMQCVH